MDRVPCIMECNQSTVTDKAKAFEYHCDPSSNDWMHTATVTMTPTTHDYLRNACVADILCIH